MLNRIKPFAPHVLAGLASVVFLDSLRFKFTNAPETQVIFGTLNDWAASLGADGLFAQTGLFSQYTIGTAEGLAALLLLAGIHPALRTLQGVGAMIALAVMTGAISFHLFTPLGIDPNNDGGGLFVIAMLVWAAAVSLVAIRRREIGALLTGIRSALMPQGLPTVAAGRGARVATAS
ncbi:MAG: hypothetical protein AAF253_14380 [Pseudomonadota bacterium]